MTTTHTTHQETPIMDTTTTTTTTIWQLLMERGAGDDLMALTSRHMLSLAQDLVIAEREMRREIARLIDRAGRAQAAAVAAGHVSAIDSEPLNRAIARRAGLADQIRTTAWLIGLDSAWVFEQIYAGID